jgi:membrane protein implicated in regulation of membrane protease activity
MDDRGEELVGKIGKVTVPIEPAHPGEVMLPVRGGTEAFAACADVAIAKHARIVVVDWVAGRSVTVAPFP